MRVQSLPLLHFSLFLIYATEFAEERVSKIKRNEKK